jgi:putative transposase
MYKMIKYSHGMGQNAYHFVFRTKNNLKFFMRPELRASIELYLHEAAEKHRIGIYCMKVMPNHVHMFVELHPTMSVSRAVKLLKGNTSRRFFKKYTIWYKIVRQRYSCGHLWSRWRFTRSVGSVQSDVIENYIQNSTHNQIASFRNFQTKLVK